MDCHFRCGASTPVLVFNFDETDDWCLLSACRIDIACVAHNPIVKVNAKHSIASQ